jgi:hypothetical protein
MTIDHSFGAFDAAAVLIAPAAVLGYLNHRLHRWPFFGGAR